MSKALAKLCFVSSLIAAVFTKNWHMIAGSGIMLFFIQREP